MSLKSLYYEKPLHDPVGVRVEKSNAYPGGSSSRYEYPQVYQTVTDRTWATSPPSVLRSFLRPPSVPYLSVRKFKGPRISYLRTYNNPIFKRVYSGRKGRAGGWKVEIVGYRQKQKIRFKRLRPSVFRIRYRSSGVKPKVIAPPCYLLTKVKRVRPLNSVGSFEDYYPPDPTWKHVYSGDIDFVKYNFENNVRYGYTPDEFWDKNDLSSTISNLTTSSLDKVWSRISDKKFSVSQMLAEREEVSGTIRDIISRVAKGIISLRHGNLIDAVKALFPTSAKQLANDVLIVQYGIRPLMGDLSSCISFLTHPFQYPQTCSAVSSNKGRYMHVPLATANGISKTVYEDFDVYVKHGCSLTFTNETNYYLNAVGLTDLVSLGWEVIPYSFIVDWFVNVSSVLQSLEVSTAVKPSNAYRTVFYRKVIRSSSRVLAGQTSYAPYKWKFDMTLGWYAEYVYCQRQPLPTLPLPELHFKDNPLTLEHLLNATALVSQLLLGKSK